MEVIRFIVALFMAIIIPISGFFTELFAKGDEEILTYTEFENQEKSSRDYGELKKEKYDIVVSNTEELLKAKEDLKTLRKDGITEKITVWLSGGDYVLADTLVFDETDAENAVYRAMPNEEVNFTGAIEINKWYEDTQNGVKVLCADIPDGLTFAAVTKDGTTLPKTRYPETGYLQIETEDHTDAIWTEENVPWIYNLGDRAFIGNMSYNPTEIKNVENVIVRVLHKWVNDLHYLKSYDSVNNKYYLANPTGMTVQTGDKYFFENIFEELNSPREWYFDVEENKLYYVPEEGETAENTVINACINDKLISMSDVKNIEFFGITFCATDFSSPEKASWNSEYGICFPQAEYDVESAVNVTKSENINFTNCNFYNIGNTALKYDTCVKNSSVKSCHFKNLGASGVYIHGFNAIEEELITENITVYDCKIESYGRNWQSAIGVFLTHARNCTIEHNEITDGYYTAISVGWVWGYSYSVTGGNLIKDNLIYNIGQGWLSDMGGIYTLGEQTGTVISGNVIHDVAADPNEGGYGGWGLYFDEGSSNIVAENNLVYSCGSNSFHQHYGKDNILRNNIFALSDEGQIRCTKNEDHNELHFTSNIVLTNENPTYVDIREGKFTDDSNIYWDLQNGKHIFGTTEYVSSSKSDMMYDTLLKLTGYNKNAVYENPEFRDPENGDFLIADENEAIEKIGFTPWDYTKAGTVSKF